MFIKKRLSTFSGAIVWNCFVISWKRCNGVAESLFCGMTSWDSDFGFVFTLFTN